MSKYKIILNDKQLSTAVNALEVLSRVHSGQWDMVFDDVFRMNFNKYKYLFEKMDEPITFKEIKDFLRRQCKGDTLDFYTILDFLKYKLLGLDPNEGIGIANDRAENEMRTAFDIKQVLRVQLGDKRQPFRYDDENELPTIEKLDEEEGK